MFLAQIKMSAYCGCVAAKDRSMPTECINAFPTRFCANFRLSSSFVRIRRGDSRIARLPIPVYRADALPFGEGGSALPNRERCRKSFRFPLHFGEFRISSTSSVTPSACHLPQRGRLNSPRNGNLLVKKQGHPVGCPFCVFNVRRFWDECRISRWR